ncbi:MAG: glycosyltransferase [Akkermansiaceae bacterium]|nr:glycosyltransferase [Verrucomicrobiales bacterium]
MSPPATNIRVKFLTKSPARDVSGAWRHFFPGQNPTLGGCHFLFDRDERNYDWIVVYDDLPSVSGERNTLWEEVLACPRERTLLLTSEPAAVKVYGHGFLRQFGWVLTSQEPWVIRHPGAIYSQTGLIWFYAGTHDEVSANPPKNKAALIATVCSSKQQTHTLHKHRYQFTQRLKQALPELEIFGHGVRYIERKNEALDSFRYHVAIENHVCQHHWTEKLADSFLGMCLPFYHGAPNAADYFPAESFIPINIHNFDESLARIRQAIRDKEYERRLPAIHEARRLVLERYSTFPQLARLISERHLAHSPATLTPRGSILSRHAWRRRHPIGSVGFGLEKLWVALRLAASRRSR